MARVKSNDSPTCMPPSTVKAQFCCPGRWGAVVTVAFRQWPTPGAYWMERFAFSRFGNLCFFFWVVWCQKSDELCPKMFLDLLGLFWDVHKILPKLNSDIFFQTYAVLHSQIMDVHWSTQLNISFRPPSPVDGYFVGVTFDRGWMVEVRVDWQNLPTKRQQLNSKWLAGGFKYLFMFIAIWGRFPFWLIFFRWVVQPPTRKWSSQLFLQVSNIPD